MPDARFDVVVVGAGAVGACTAYELARSGASVAVVEAGDGWGGACTWGNTGLIAASHAGPYARIQDLVNAVRWLAKPDGPFGVELSPSITPFLLRLLRECVDVRRARRATEVLLDLTLESAVMHAHMSADGLDTGYRRDGHLDVYLTQSGFDRASRSYARGPSQEIEEISILCADDARAREPLLDGELAGAIFNPVEARCDPGRFGPAVGAAAEAAGATLHTGFRVVKLDSGSQEVCVRSPSAELSAAHVVLATGAEAAELAPGLPVIAGIGCSIDLTGARDVPRSSILIDEAHIAIAPFADRLRFAGTMLLSERPRRRTYPLRIESIYRAGTSLMPALLSAKRSAGWIGARACTPDGLPRIGWLGSDRPRVLVATGHAMSGVSLAPVTGKLVAGLVSGVSDSRLARLNVRSRADE